MQIPDDVNVAEEMKKMEYEPLQPIELTLIRWSLGLGAGGLVVLYLASVYLFPGGH